jgi:hypothetical protein
VHFCTKIRNASYTTVTGPIMSTVVTNPEAIHVVAGPSGSQQTTMGTSLKADLTTLIGGLRSETR